MPGILGRSTRVPEVRSGKSPVQSCTTPDFLALSENERVQEASDFYKKHVRRWEFKYVLGDENGLKQWMIATARLGTDEAPVNHWLTEWSGGLEIPYRPFEVTGIVFKPRLDYILFNENALLITAFISLAIWIVIILATLVIRWVYRGFAKE